MHFNLTLLTALAVFFHMGLSLAGQLLRDRTDREKIAKIDHAVTVAQALATAIAPLAPSLAGVLETAGKTADKAKTGA